MWEGLLRQAGAVQVYSIEEMIDMAAAFVYMRPPAGRNTVVLGVGGGASVVLADEFSRTGLSLPKFSTDARQKLIGLYSSEAGRIFKNPVDINNFESPETFAATIQAIEAEDMVDFMVIHVAFDHFGLVSEKAKVLVMEVYRSLILDLKGKVNKPAAIILHSYASEKSKKIAGDMGNALTKSGFAVFLSIRSAAVALNKYIAHQQRPDTVRWEGP